MTLKGWRWKSPMYGFQKPGTGLRVWNVYDPPQPGFWHWSNGDFTSKGEFQTAEAAQKAAEDATK